MENFIIDIIVKLGYWGIFLLISLENIFPPIPSEVILLFSGFMVNKSQLNTMLIILFATLGSILGAIILYYMGVSLNNKTSMVFVNERIGKIFHFNEKDINSAIFWFNNRGNKSVFWGRFIPIIRSLISIPAGVSRMKMHIFIFYTFFGSFIWNAVLVYFGKITGDNWQVILKFFDTYKMIVIFLFMGVIIIFLIYYFEKKR